MKRNSLLHERAVYNDIVAHVIKKFQLLRHRSFYFLLCSEGTTSGPVPYNSSILLCSEGTTTGPVPYNSSSSIQTLTKPHCALFISAVTCSCNPPFNKTTTVLNEEKL